MAISHFVQGFPRGRWWKAAAAGFVVSAVLVGWFQAKGEEMSYRQAREFLAAHTKLVELTDGHGARVAICPDWQGRVMTSTCGGMDGPSFGFIHAEFIKAGKLDKHFNNYGGEDRLWLSPEGGRFSLWFAPGARQDLDHWFTAPALNEGGYQVTSGPHDPYYRMVRLMQLRNASATNFELSVTRTVRLLGEADLRQVFGPAAQLMLADGVERVAYETANTLSNEGPAMSKEKGLVSIWVLGMMNAAPKTVVIVPYRPGDEAQLGPVVKSDYFGAIPPQRLKILPQAILFRADGNYRSKIGTSQRRARNVAGSIDFAGGVLTLIQFTMPDDPTKCDYMNNMWGADAANPYTGAVANSYNDGPPAPGKKGLGAFYEIESLSPAKALETGGLLTHHHRTVHIRADQATLAKIAQQVLGVDLDTVRKEMLGP